jgi:hypothetical protein
MEIRSLGFRTDLFFHRANGEVFDRGEYLVVRTPKNPGFFWGNLLYFAQAPKEGDQDLWQALFQKEFADMDVHHLAFAWEGSEKGIPFENFALEPTVTMTGSEFLKPKVWNANVHVRPLISEQDFAAALENQVRSRENHFEETEYRLFVKRKQEAYRALIQAGKGYWLGAFLGKKLCGDQASSARGNF